MKQLSLVSVIVVIVLILDQFTKWLVASTMQVGQSIYPIPALDFFSITFVTNTGVAFGLFRDAGVIFAIVSIVVIVVVVRYLRHLPPGQWLMRVALSLVLAGAIGNLIDRLRQGYVIDFVAVAWWPKFNVADAAIVLGVGLLTLGMLLDSRRSSPHGETIHPGHDAWRAADSPPESRERRETRS